MYKFVQIVHHPCCSDRGVVHTQAEKTQVVALLQCQSMYDGQTQHVATHGRTIISIPRIQSLAPNHRKDLIFRDNRKMGPPDSMVPEFVETTPWVVLVGALFSQCKKGGGEGGCNAVSVANPATG